MNKKLFVVEFGRPESNWPSAAVFVIAKSFNEAEEKAKLHLESKKPEPKSIVNAEGDLMLNRDETLNVKGIKVVSEEIVM